jgi:endonuclease YncB( thermonuclease family)
MPLNASLARCLRRWRQACTGLLCGISIGLAPAAPAAAATELPGILGTVTSVVDGDSLWVTPAAGGNAIEVRLAGIDAPEICQEHGAESRRFLAEQVLRQPVRLQVAAGSAGRDHYGRTLGTLFLGGVEVNRLLVEEGQAWSIRTKWDRGPYVAQERMARALNRGLHKAGSAAITPKDFRLRHGPCTGTEVAPPAIADRAAPAAVPAAEPPAATAADFRCDGRTRCSQMRSCAEATFFLRHCPGVKMDGNHDGVPCEQQWCRPH